MLKYQPGTPHLRCEYCDHRNEINENNDRIEEYDLNQALHQLEQATHISETEQAHCRACGASFQFASHIYAGACPFCGTDIVTDISSTKPIQPKSLLPFLIDEQQAKEKFHAWLGRLWFAPSAIKKYARKDTHLNGIYLPYWTYDSYTQTRYSGMRGDTYYVRQRVSVIQNGRQVSRIKRIPKIRWTPINGHVSRFFDDVLIGASLSLPRQILDRLQPWDLHNLEPYNEKYISGFQSEVYQIELNQGFDQAKQVMSKIIHQDIAQDIGGDHQRIHHASTRHHETTYKHCLLPVWSAAFQYKNKPYRFVVNGRTGQVQGERPYSYWKIALAVTAGILFIAGGALLLDKYGIFDQQQPEQYYIY